ncbi:hypothetical protein GGR55DRAFT_367464 [Xylaria sp. FL0064]|nr:hypothetical protein GGR55DRAFT_367464 [Xylaria sp. FL0064]
MHVAFKRRGVLLFGLFCANDSGSMNKTQATRQYFANYLILAQDFLPTLLSCYRRRCRVISLTLRWQLLITLAACWYLPLNLCLGRYEVHFNFQGYLQFVCLSLACYLLPTDLPTSPSLPHFCILLLGQFSSDFKPHIQSATAHPTDLGRVIGNWVDRPRLESPLAPIN